MILVFIITVIVLLGGGVCYEYLFSKNLIVVPESKYSDLGKSLDEVIGYFKDRPQKFVFDNKDKEIFVESSHEVSLISNSNDKRFDLYIYGNGATVKSVAFECFFYNSKEDDEALKEVIDLIDFFEKNSKTTNWVNYCYDTSFKSSNNLVSEKFENKNISVNWYFEKGSKHLRLEINPS